MNLQVFRTDKMLTEVSVQYRNTSFIADQIFPEVPVDDQEGTYFEFGRASNRPVADSRRPGTVATEIDLDLQRKDYYCDGHALRAPIPDVFRKKPSGGMTLNIDTTTFLTDVTQLNQDLSIFDVISTSLTPVDLSADGGAQWDNSDIDPIDAIDAAISAQKLKTRKRPNVLLLSDPTVTGIRKNPKVKGRITGAPGLDGAKIAAEQLASLLSLERVIIADVTVNRAAEGQDEATEYVWGKTALLFYRAENPGLRALTFGYHLMWQTGRNGSVTRVYRDEDRESDIIEVQKYYDQKIICADAATFFTNAVA